MIVLHPTYQTNQPIKVGVVQEHSKDYAYRHAIRKLEINSWLISL